MFGDVKPNNTFDPTTYLFGFDIISKEDGESLSIWDHIVGLDGSQHGRLAPIFKDF